MTPKAKVDHDFKSRSVSLIWGMENLALFSPSLSHSILSRTIDLYLSRCQEPSLVRFRGRDNEEHNPGHSGQRSTDQEQDAPRCDVRMFWLANSIHKEASNDLGQETEPLAICCYAGS